MIKNYSQYINESDSASSTDVVNFLNEVSRAYNDDVYLGHFLIEKEIRKWNELRKHAKLKKSITEDAHYELFFEENEKRSHITCEFDMTFYGQTEADVPDNSFEIDADRMGIVLDNIDIKRLIITSDKLNYSSSDVAGSVKHSMIDLLSKVMRHDYDILSGSFYKFQQ